jgi:hypothetical protein
MSKKYHGGKNKAQTTSQRYHGGKNNKQEVKIYKHKQTRNVVTASADKGVKGQGCQGTAHHFSNQTPNSSPSGNYQVIRYHFLIYIYI